MSPSSLLLDPIQYLCETAAKRATEAAATELPQAFADLKGFNPRKLPLLDADGQIVWLDVPRPLRRCHVESVADLCAALQQYGNTCSSVWIAGDKIVAVFDDGDRLEYASLLLHCSAVWQRIVKLVDEFLSQTDFVRLLRFDLGPKSVQNYGPILQAVRNVKFSRRQDGMANLQHTSASLGQSIEAEITGAGELPEELIVVTNVYANRGEVEQILRIALPVEIDVHGQVFRVAPVGDELRIAEQLALGSIRERIEEALPGVPVFCGTP